MRAEIFQSLDVSRKEYLHAVLPITAELLGCALMHALGVGAPSKAEVIDGTEARQRDRREWIFKTTGGIGLSFCADITKVPDSEPVLAIAKIPGAVPLSWLRGRYGMSARRCNFDGYSVSAQMRAADPLGVALLERFAAAGRGFGPFDGECHALIEECYRYLQNGGSRPLRPFIRWEFVKWYLAAGNKVRDIPGAADFYRDFEWKLADLAEIRQSICWNSSTMLKIHAARAWAGISTAHYANILVDHSGHLFNVDFANMELTDGEEIEQLFRNIVPRTTAFEALRPVAQLRAEQIREIFDGLPDLPFPWPLGSKAETVDYYVARLGRWQNLFQEKDHC